MEVISIATERCGVFTVYIQGVLPKNAPVLLTVPDLGCDHSYYAQFVNNYIPGRFSWCHIELPGQSYGSEEWIATSAATGESCSGLRESLVPEAGTAGRKSESAASGDPGQSKTGKSSSYPTMQELAFGVQTILEKLEISQVVLFAEGAGANLLARVAVLCDERVLGALLIHGRCTPSGPLQLLRDKMRNWKSSNIEPATEKYLLDHRFGTVSNVSVSETLKAEMARYKQVLFEKVNAKNLNMLTYTYAHRTSLADMVHELKCPILFISGTLSGHRSGVRHMFEVMNKSRKDDPRSRTNLELIEIDDTVVPLIEKPEKIAECALYFLQGLGIVTSVKSVSGTSTRKCSAELGISSASPEKRTCAEFVNLDSFSPTSNVDTGVNPVEATVENETEIGKTEGSVSSRFFTRQLSMAELDLPRGPDALCTIKIITSATSGSTRKYSQTSTADQTALENAD